MSRWIKISLFCLLPFASFAQDVTGSVSGTVTDPAGAAIVGASVKLVSDTTDTSETRMTNGEGDFIFTNVKPGFYSITAENPGFKKFEKSRLPVEAEGHRLFR